MNDEEYTTDYISAVPGQVWWCNTHQRRATSIAVQRRWGAVVRAEHCCCSPKLGGMMWAGVIGVMIPCKCVNLTGIAEIT